MLTNFKILTLNLHRVIIPIHLDYQRTQLDMAPRRSSAPSNDDDIIDPRDRSAADYDSIADIRKALSEFDLSGDADWALKNYDVKTTVASPNSLHEEAERLMVLKSYGILDSDKEVEFEAITNECKEFFDCPIAVVSLVDMGRQWFKSIQGLPVESTPRCVAFCSHVVKRKDKDGVMVVPDATKDPRFKENPLVTGGPMIRFYAGAPLKTPEGVRVGSLCVIDTKPHPEGLTLKEKDRLTSLAQEVVFNMVMRTSY